ncbi:Hypothetical protein NGAL_HAMBI2427_42450 [Neorhizobium galegae bv. orientalis]|nr:Hypothetical protein NGAL_HAMBI2427_42450 [Neorhizobium galegae bv. orientalis]
MVEKSAQDLYCIAASAWLQCDLSAGGRRSLWYLGVNEAMHLLPQSFVFQATHSSSQGKPDGTAALLLPAVVQFFRKACRTSSRGRLFRFPIQSGPEFRRQSRLPCSTGSPDFDTIVDPYGSREEMISASSGSGRARSFASSQGARIQMSVSSFVSNRTGMAFSWIGFTRSLGSVVKNP